MSTWNCLPEPARAAGAGESPTADMTQPRLTTAAAIGTPAALTAAASKSMSSVLMSILLTTAYLKPVWTWTVVPTLWSAFQGYGLVGRLLCMSQPEDIIVSPAVNQTPCNLFKSSGLARAGLVQGNNTLYRGTPSGPATLSRVN